MEIAINGYGKSQLYERMLSTLFPQVIHHGEYNGRVLTCTQLVWLKVECPYNKSVGTFCKSFYAEVDKVLGTNFYEKFAEKQGTIDNKVMRLIKVAAQINLGVLVIDEIQKIQKAYSGGEDNMVDFITQFVNTLGVPTILIGSFKALYLFKDSLANTRRGIPNGFAESISGYMTNDSWEWNHFIENLWSLQYTRTYTELTPSIKEAMHFYSMGIPDFAVKLFIHVQSRAIVNGGDERMNVARIREVAEKSFNLVQPIFERMRSGDLTAYKDLDDVQPDWAPLNGYIKEANHRLHIHGSVAVDHARVLQKKDKEEVLEKLTEFALYLGKSPKVAEALANQVYSASAGMGDISSMFGQIAQLVQVDEKDDKTKKEANPASNVIPKKKPPKKDKPALEQVDIRYIVQQGHKKGLATEEALEEKRYIREADELLQMMS